MSNTITLPRVDWDIITHIVSAYMNNSNLRGGSLQLILDDIHTQLDKQEY